MVVSPPKLSVTLTLMSFVGGRMVEIEVRSWLAAVSGIRVFFSFE